MKRIKKLASLMLAMVMAMAMTMTVFAAEADTPPTPPANEPERVEADLSEHTYTAYQIFAGTQSEDDENALATITWGSGIDAESFMEELKTSDMFGESNPFAEITYVANDPDDSRTGNASATAVAKVLADHYKDTAMAEAFAKIADKHVSGDGSATVVDGEKVTLSAGYYLVVDTTTSPLPGENPVRNVSVLQLTKANTFEPRTKVDVPEVTKKVKNTDDAANPPAETEWQDHADYDTGDDVPFILTGTLPTDYARYETYKYVFHDKQSDGLEFNNDVVVRVDGNRIDSGYEVITEGLSDGCTFEVRFTDLKTLAQVTANSIITVEYTAELTAEAIPDASGITNSVKLEYSNNSNSNGEGETGTTPDDIVTVFTYKIVANKTDANGDPLTGAAFTLYKLVNGDYVELEVLNEGTEFSFKGIDAGQYKLSETVVPNGYNRAEDIEFKVVPVYDEEAETPTLKELKLTDLSGNVISGENGDFTINVGTATTEIQNQRGSLLPSTGGIGTTIFYVVGAVLAIGAGILLVTRKRMGVR